LTLTPLDVSECPCSRNLVYLETQTFICVDRRHFSMISALGLLPGASPPTAYTRRSLAQVNRCRQVYPLNLVVAFPSASHSRAQDLRSHSRGVASSSDGTRGIRACSSLRRRATSPSGGRVGRESATIARAD